MIKGKSRTTVKGQERVDRLRKAIKTLQDAYVTIGVHEDAGEYPEGVSVVSVAFWHEFGTQNLPERSFLRSALDENIGLINGWRVEMLEKIAKGMPVEKALEAIGLRVQLLIQNKIKSNIPPPLAPETIARKKREGVPPRTLIETGLLLRSISFRVVTR